MARKIVLKSRHKKLLLFLLVLLGVSLFLHFKFRPVIKAISVSKAKVISTEAVNEAILQELSENKEAYNQIVKLEKLENGELTAILSDMEKVNKLKSRVGMIIQNKFLSLKDRRISVALGTLSGIEMFNGLGPSVPMKISVSGNVSTDFKTSFSGAGINQTIYQIYLYIRTRICVMVPGCSCCEDFESSFLVSEIVVLGNVPKVYSSQGNLNVSPSE